MNIEYEEQKRAKEIELESKERIIQTIIILYSLLLVFNQSMSNEIKALSLVNFMMFLSAALLYYFTISIPKRKKLRFPDFFDSEYTNYSINFLAVCISLSFSLLLFLYEESIIQTFNGWNPTRSIIAVIPITLIMYGALKI